MFDQSMTVQALERLRLESDLRRAIEQGEFLLHYQPKVVLKDGEIFGVEALVRWEHPEQGLVSPARFIPVAEETGLIVPLGRWVLKEACRQAKEWQERYPADPPLAMSVNLSARQFRDLGLVEEVAGILEESGLDASSLILEITETAAMEDVSFTTAMLGELKALGVKLAMDDFGTGYTSLSYLKRFPVDILKIDRSIVSEVDRHPEDAAIVSATITLAHALGLGVVAEGVETSEELAELHKVGCDIGQGYYWWRPSPANAVAALLEGHPVSS